MTFFKYPHIEKFSDVIYMVNNQYNNLIKPIITFKGTIKLHGTNAAVCKKEGEIWYQSRQRIISINNDNMGFSKWMSEKVDLLLENYDDVIIFGEFCGKGIQNGVGISRLDQMFVIFNILINGDFIEQVPENIEILNNNRIYHINQFKTYTIKVNFNDITENELQVLNQYTEEVEKECPVAKYFNINNGVGEGIVWKPLDAKYYNSDYWFKTKGQKHSNFKSDKLTTPIIPEIEEFLNSAITEIRLEQAWQSVQHNSMQDIPIFIKWIVSDILREERLIILENNLPEKFLIKEIGNRARDWYVRKLNNNFTR